MAKPRGPVCDVCLLPVAAPPPGQPPRCPDCWASVHACCPQAKATLSRSRVNGGAGDAWRLRVPVADDSAFKALVSVIYCPWCGVELEEWRRLQRPRLEVVRDADR